MQGRRSIFDDTIELFRKLHISDHSRPNASWKSVQTGMIIATAAALNLRQLLVRCKGLMFLQSSRFSKEALENLFSAMEVKSPVLRARTLGLVMIAQLFVF